MNTLIYIRNKNKNNKLNKKMKKILITIIGTLMTLLISAPCVAYNYLVSDDNNFQYQQQKMGTYINKSGQINNVSFTVDRTKISDSTEPIKFNISGDFDYYNFAMMHGMYWYKHSFGSFVIYYEILYGTTPSNMTNSLVKKEEQLMLDMEFVGCTSNGCFMAPHLAKNFGTEITASLPQNLNNKQNYYFTAKVTIAPFGYNISNKAVTTPGKYIVFNEKYQNSEMGQEITTPGMHYEATSCNYRIVESFGEPRAYIFYNSHSKQATNTITIEYEYSTFATISAIQTYTPLTQGTSERYYIYNNPNAIFAVSLIKNENSASTYNTTSYAYSFMLASIGLNSTPTVEKSVLYSEYSDQCTYGTVSSTPFEHVEYVNDNQAIKTFIKNNYTWNNSYKRVRAVLLSSTDKSCTTWDNATCFPLANLTPESDNVWYTKKYHLRDLNLVKYPENSTIKEGTIFKVQNKLVYWSAKPENMSQGNNAALLGMGLSFYGPNYEYDFAIPSLTATNRTSKNTITFEIVPAAKFHASENNLISYQCESTSSNMEVNSTNDYIYIDGATITTGTVSPQIYGAQYHWQVRFSEKEGWRELNTAFPEYVLVDTLINATLRPGMNEEDLLVHSSIINKSSNKKIFFRQIAVLKSFPSETHDQDLYNYYENGLYYISVASDEVYERTSYPILTEDNFKWMGDDESFVKEDTKIQNICADELPVANKMSFSICSSSNVDVENFKDDIRYYIYKVDAKGAQVLLKNGNTYNMEYKKDSIKYLCRISLCDQTIDKYVCVNPFPRDTIALDRFEAISPSKISKLDEIGHIIYMTCPKGETAGIKLEKRATANTNFFARIEGYICPEPMIYNPTDFTLKSAGGRWTHTNLSDTITYNAKVLNKSNWDFEKLNNKTFEETLAIDLVKFCTGQERVDFVADSTAQADDCKKRLSWYKFTQPAKYLTSLDNITGNSGDATFYVRTQNVNNGNCYSDSVTIKVTYIDYIVDNTIYVSASPTDTIYDMYLTANEANRQIYGTIAKGGYGEPKEDNDYSYFYEWEYSIDEVYWVPFKPAIEATAIKSSKVYVTTSGVMLPENTMTGIDRTYYVHRNVYSRNNGEKTSEMVSTSNIVSIYVESQLNENDISIENNGKCPGTTITIKVNERDLVPNENLVYVWTCSDKNINMQISYSAIQTGTTFNYGNVCTITKSTDDFSFSVYRYDRVKDSKSNTVTMDIDVSTLTVGFEVIADNLSYEVNGEEDMSFNPGQKILLNNTSEGDGLTFTWTLQIQEFIEGVKTEGTKSNIASPSCYLYNPGYNKIRLDARNNAGCTATMTAENIFVTNISNGRKVYSYFGDESSNDKFALAVKGNEKIVYPTIITSSTGYTLFVNTDMENYDVVVLSSIGQKMLERKVSANTTIDMSQYASGAYVVFVGGDAYKVIIK